MTGTRSENFSINVYSSLSGLNIMQRYQWLVLWLIPHYCLLNDYAALFLFCLNAISMDLLPFITTLIASKIYQYLNANRVPAGKN